MNLKIVIFLSSIVLFFQLNLGTCNYHISLWEHNFYHKREKINLKTRSRIILINWAKGNVTRNFWWTFCQGNLSYTFIPNSHVKRDNLFSLNNKSLSTTRQFHT